MNAIHVGYTDRIGWLMHLKATFDEKLATHNRQLKKCERAMVQAKLLGEKIRDLGRRYKYAVQAEKQDFCDSLSLQLTTLKGVRKMFLEYHARLAGELTSLAFETRALVDEIEMLKRYSIEGIPRGGINPVIAQVPRHLGSYSLVAAMDPPSPEVTAAQSPEATTAHRPSPEVSSTHRPSPDVSTTHRLCPEVTSTNCPCPEGEGSDGGWTTVQRRKKGKNRRPQDQQSE